MFKGLGEAQKEQLSTVSGEGREQDVGQDIDQGFEKGVGNDQPNKEKDVQRARRRLSDAGYDVGDVQSGVMDKDLERATRSFQEEQGLKQDGIMKPKGETEVALDRYVQRKKGKSGDKEGIKGGYFDQETLPLRIKQVVGGDVGVKKGNIVEDIQALENILAGFGLIKQGRADQRQGQMHQEIVNAIKIFQKDNDLRVDGVMFPGGETEQVMNKELRRIFIPIPKKSERPVEGGIVPVYDRDEKAEERVPSKYGALEEASINLFRYGEEILKGTTPKPQQETQQQSKTKQTANKTKEEAAKQPVSSYDPYAVPEYKKDWYDKESDNRKHRDKWIEGIKKNEALSEREKIIYTEMYTAEGGDAVFDGTTRAGVTQQAFEDLKETKYHQKMIKKHGEAVKPDVLDQEDIQGFYQAYFDEYLKGAAKGYSKKNNLEVPKKGSEMFDELDNQFVAIAVADSVFRHGPHDGTKLIQQSINDVLKKEDIQADGGFGSGTFEKLQDIAKDKEQSKTFLEKLGDNRIHYLKIKSAPTGTSDNIIEKIDIGGDLDRNKYFQFNSFNK